MEALKSLRVGHDGPFTAGRIAALGAISVAAAAGAWALAGRIPSFTPTRKPGAVAAHGLHVERTVTVMCSADDLYARWRDFARLPELMPHVESVTPLFGGHWRWVVCGPAESRLTWDAELTADEPGRLIAWRSLPGGDVEHAGTVRFTPAPADRGTEVKVRLSYLPPAGVVGGALATFLGAGGDQEVREDLRRFKQRVEAGEIATSGRDAAETR
jgi:uncharacterized membrane protein